ncbi:MAG TPA: ATP synthase subunit I [Candidatus Acidoferrales bacterium]|nr:ATP synthase subunit I [Candidatus Acidoferrales bacterium]
MSEEPHNERTFPPEPEELIPSPPPSPLSLAFYSGAVARIQRLILVLGMLLTVALAAKWGTYGVVGAALGTALAYFNFSALVRSVEGIGDRIVNSNSPERGSVLVVRFVGRIFLIAIAGYAIFNLSVRGLYALLAGLCIPVAAMLCEAAYETFAAFRRGL